MESKKTAELRRRKGSIKAKLMAAVAMLLVSTIMLSSTTYAWFVLSTAPEVKGMSTTVGSNGSLEIALLNNSTGADTSTISSGVGDSSAKQDVQSANVTWGNIVDLSSGYGLDQLTLYPSELNLTDSKAALVNLYSALAIPVYGVDGRVAETSATNVVAGTYKTNADGPYFTASNADYGVRAVGTSDTVSPVARALDNARTNYNVALNAVQYKTGNLLSNKNSVALTKILLQEKVGTTDYAGITVSITVENEDIEALGTVISDLETTVTGIQAALACYVMGYQASQGTVIAETDVQSVITAIQAKSADERNATETYILDCYNKLTDLQTEMQDTRKEYDKQAAITDGTASYSDVIKYLIDSETVTVEGNLLSYYNTDNALKLMDEPDIVVNGGLLSDVADFAGQFASRTFNVPLSNENELAKISDATITVNPNYTADTTDATDARVNPILPYLQTNNPGADADDDIYGINYMTTPEGDSGAKMIATAYGYAIDLAFRASADTNLLLSEVANRVDEDTSTQGAGSTFTLTAGGDVDAMEAMRVVFVKNDTTGYTILGVALPEEDADNDGVYELHMYEWDAANGTVGAARTSEVITALTADTVTTITALVYLDGNEVASAMGSAQGTLNLQFASSTTLVPMDYTGYVTSVAGDSGDTNSDSGDTNSDSGDTASE